MADDDKKLPNPDIVEAGKNTRFGQPGGADPKEAAKKAEPWSIRRQVGRLAAAEFGEEFFDSPEKSLSPREIAKKFGNPKALTGAQIIAVRKFTKALTGDVKALQQVTDDVDGKQVQKVMEAQVTLAELVEGSYKVDGSSDSETKD